MRRAKIVCTLGPASSTPERLAELVAAGMDVARLNMSHGDYADHERNLRSVRDAAEGAGRPVGVLADLQGPKIRIGKYRKRTGYRRHTGHRSKFSEIEIQSIGAKCATAQRKTSATTSSRTRTTKPKEDT